MKPGAWEALMRDLKQQEGYRDHAYLDTVGVWTIGYGFTQDVRPGDTITLTEANDYLGQRAQLAVNDARRLLSNFDQLDAPRQAVMANMAYNLGIRRLGQFRNTLANVNAGNYAAAAKGMRASLWCKQVKGRCGALARSMETGQFIPH
jgi:lysozyme